MSVGKVKWSPDQITVFLETFQNYDLLWNPRNINYMNKNRRESALLKLKEDLVAQGILVPDLQFLRARIKAIRTTYRSELLKVQSSKVSGAGAEDVYTPKLPWFGTADNFLNCVTITRDSQSNLEIHPDPISESQASEEVDEPEEIASPSQPPKKKQRLNKINKIEKAIGKLEEIAAERRQGSARRREADEYEAFGQHIAAQLRHLPAMSFITLQEKIQRIITAERLRTLMAEIPSTSSASPQTPVEIEIFDEEIDYL